MLRLVFHIIFIVLVLPVSGQDNKLFVKPHEGELTRHIQSLKRKQSAAKDELQFLHKVFHKTQSRFFKNYAQYAEFHEIFESGKYNCLTGTIIYAIIFRELGYNVRMFETRYHSFLILDVDKDQVLIEATDPLKGVVVGKADIDDRIKVYLNKEANLPEEPTAMTLKGYPPIQPVTFTQLIGLLYLNKGVVNINRGNFKIAIKDLEDAKVLYPESDRIADLLYTATSQCDMAPLSGTAITTDNLNNN